MADEIIIETTSQEVIEVGVPGPQGATGPQGPAGAAGASTWNDITGKPSTFAPSAHASTHHSNGSDPLTPANIGAAKDFTEIEVGNTGTSTTTLTTAQLPARVILFLDASGEASATINLPTPDARQSGLTASIKVQRESGTTDSALITVVHSGTTLLYTELAEAEGSITFVWDGYEWSYSNKFFFANFAGRNLLLPASSGTLALTESADNVFRVVGSADATKKVAFEVDGITTATTRTLTVPNASGTIALTSNFAAPPAIGITTPNTVAATDLSASNKLSLPSAAAASPTAGDLYRNANTLRYRDSTNTERLLLNATDNLSNLADAATARANLGLGGWATLSDGAALGTENLIISDGESPNFIQFTAGTGVIFNGNRAAQFRGALGLGTSNNVTFGSLTANNGTLTASAPVLDLAQTWNASGVTFTGLRLNATDTASAAASNLADFQVGGTSVTAIRKDGSIRFQNGDRTLLSHPNFAVSSTAGGAWLGVNTTVSINGGLRSVGGTLTILTAQSTDAVILDRDAANTFAQRNGAAAQEYRIYGQYTTASNFERLSLKYNSTATAFQIGTEKGTSGGARPLQLQVDGTTRVDCQTTGSVVINGTTFFAAGGASGNNFNADNRTRIGSAGLECGSAGSLTFHDGTFFTSSTADTRIRRVSAGLLEINNVTAGTYRDLVLRALMVGGTTASFPALRNSSTTLQVRLANDSAFAPLSCGALTLNGNLDASTRDLVTDTTTGTKIGTATDQKIGFWNATPAIQPAAVADATDAATTQARLNDLLARLRTIGIIAAT